MKKIDIKEILMAKMPKLFNEYPKFVSVLVVNFFNKLLRVSEINKFIELNNHHKGIEFVDALFKYLNFKYILTDKSLERIPSEGKVVIISNHPLGGLDGLALVKAVKEVRNDVRIVANDILSNIENLNDLFLPFDMYSPKNQKENIINIDKALQNDEAVIFFPAGEVSRMSWTGIKDGKWRKGAARFATKNQAPILPAFVHARNSFIFYFLSIFWRRIGLFLLPSELFKKRNKTITINFSDLVPVSKLDKSINQKYQLDLMYKHTYKVGKGKKGIFATEQTIIRPIPYELVKSELSESADLLGITNDGKKIYVCKQDKCPNVLMEVARLREVTFRKVGEGTGKSFDTAVYDSYYHHIVLWDDDENDIVGSYRLGLASEIIKNHGVEGLYAYTHIKIHEPFHEILPNSIELGRSFIQSKYWKTNALDYIWQGIGAFTMKFPEVQYLWGGVSISDSYSENAKAMIVHFYSKWYKGKANYATPIKPLIFSKNLEQEMLELFNGETVEQDFRTLKISMKALGFSIPVLFRKYTEISNPGGSTFITFSIDEGFMNAIHGVILVDLNQLRDEYKERYYSQRLSPEK